MTPYRGVKQLPVGDIIVLCRNRRSYATGLGSERITVAGDRRITKTRAEDLEIVLRGRAGTIEIIELR